MDQAFTAMRLSPPDGLVGSIQNELGIHWRGDPPADDAPGEDVDDEGSVDRARPAGKWSKRRCCASPPRTVRAPFSAYGSPFKSGPWPWQPDDIPR